MTGAYIESRPQYAGPPLTDFSSLPAAFSSLGDLGSAGSPEQPLFATAIRALTAAGNVDFRRPNAELCVVFIAPADDHSLASVDTLAAQLAVLPAVVHPVVAGIYSPGAPRMTAFLNAFPNRSTAVDIHLQDLSDGLILLGGWIGSHLASPCIDATLVDLDPGAPGLQPSCSVSDVQRPAGTEQALPACDATGSIRPCWRIAVDAQSCPPDPQLALEVLRADFPPDDTSVVAQCEALVPPND